MWSRITIVVTLALAGCASERIAESNAPDVSFAGPLRPVTLSAAQIDTVKKGIAATFKDPSSLTFGNSYRAGIDQDHQITVCGFVNGKRFVGLFAKAVGGSTAFLPVQVATTEEEQGAARQYCRDNGIYVPQ